MVCLQMFCKTEWKDVLAKHLDIPNNVDEAKLEAKCFKTVWISSVLSHLMPLTSITSTPNTVDGKVAHWTVGALLHRTLSRYYFITPMKTLLGSWLWCRCK